MSGVAKLVIFITPTPASDLRSIFSVQPNSIRRALENPPELRPHGWGLRTGTAAKSINGEWIRTESFREVIDLYRDGQLVVASRIDRDSLAWADKSDSRIHPLAFIEFVTNTLLFYKLVLDDMRDSPESVRIQMQLHDLTNGKTMTLPAGGINSLGWCSGERPARAPSFSGEVTTDGESYDATRSAFLLLREVYVWFGHADEDIPYVFGEGDERRINTEAIVSTE